MSAKVISEGIGSPASVQTYVLAGLSANPVTGGASSIISEGIGTPSGVAFYILGGLHASSGGGGAGVMRRIGYGGALVSV